MLMWLPYWETKLIFDIEFMFFQMQLFQKVILFHSTKIILIYQCFQVGDGTTSVIVLAGEMLAVAEQFLAQNIHPTVIIREYRQALEDAVKLLQEKISIPIDLNDRDKLKEVVSKAKIIHT